MKNLLPAFLFSLAVSALPAQSKIMDCSVEMNGGNGELYKVNPTI